MVYGDGMTNEKPSRTAVATAVRMRRSEEKLAEKLRARGWECVPPKASK
jgi:hypothetical protein